MTQYIKHPGQDTANASAGTIKQEVTNGAANVNTYSGTAQAIKGRIGNPDATPDESKNRYTWTTDDNVTRLKIWMYPVAETNDAAANGVSHIEADIAYDFVVDAPNYTAGTLLLGQAGGAAVDTEIFTGQYNQMRVFDSVGPITSIQFDVPVNSKVKVEAQ